MAQRTSQFLKERVYSVHEWLIQAGESVNGDQFAHVFSTNAPPIGWHLWHMARFGDRLQSKMAAITEDRPVSEIWYREDVAASWNLQADRLGVFESGMGQAHADAQASIVSAGQSKVVDYAGAVFAACDKTISKLTESDMEKTYFGIRGYAYDGKTGRVWANEPKESVIAEDLIFHSNHGSRHMGMMEALRGLLGTAGTLSV